LAEPNLAQAIDYRKVLAKALSEKKIEKVWSKNYTAGQ